MRESRQSGSVEGVMGNHHSYSDCFLKGLRITNTATVPAFCDALITSW